MNIKTNYKLIRILFFFCQYIFVFMKDEWVIYWIIRTYAGKWTISHAAAAASTFDLELVNVGAQVDETKPTADSDAIACVKSALEKAGGKKGTLLYGFPKTKVSYLSI